MPFRETTVEKRCAMRAAYESGAVSVTELCADLGISRQTFYIWKRRWETGSQRWWESGSRAPLHRPHATDQEIVERLVELRRRKPHYGPKKIHALLARQDPGVAWPAVSTIGDILKRQGLVEARRRRRPALDRGEIILGATEPNGEWAIDFKGWFRTIDGSRCDPLTISDTATRYLLDVRIMRPNHAEVRQALTRVFQETGLPDAIRSDNGAPFGSTGAGGLSQLAVFLLKLGIEPRFIPPSSPQDNGRHERMHRTLKAETTRPPAKTPQEQQSRFDAFRTDYNEERPHEAINLATPASCWTPPKRSMPDTVGDPWYDADTQVRRVRPTGDIKWKGQTVFIGEALAGETIGLTETETGAHLVKFCTRDLGFIDRETRFHRFAPPRWRLRSAVEAGNLKPA
jgi:transposase InsO family protein